MADNIRFSQTSGAGPSRSRPADIVVPPGEYLPTGSIEIRARTPTRTSTVVYEEVELGLYLHPEVSRAPTPVDKPAPESGRRGSIGSITSKVTEPGPGFFLNHSIWRTDIITFCSHVRAHPTLRNACITHVQARKSRRLPFMHEYLLIFFTATIGLRFVMRIDRLGKAGLGSAGEPMGPTRGAGTAIQEVVVYHIQDAHHGVHSASDVPWLAMDGAWGSHPVVTLVSWDKVDVNTEHVSHHMKNPVPGVSARPRLLDVSGILEGILLQMPNYHLTTANCYLMTRSSLILLQRCCPTAFACYLGPPSGDLTPPTLLAEPVWAGLLRWYLPFVALFFLLYIPLLYLFIDFLDKSVSCVTGCNTGDRVLRGLVGSLHGVLDVPLPIGIMHSYMTLLEIQINKLVVNISTEFFRIRIAQRVSRSVPDSASRRPFEVVVDNAWLVLIGWVMLGAMGAVLMFVGTSFDYGMLVVFIFMLIAGVWFNFKFSSSSPDDAVLGQGESSERLFGTLPTSSLEIPGSSSESV